MAIYAVLEAPQELYFGLRTERNVNLLETVRISLGSEGEIIKPYYSPTKQRGIERRAIAYSIVVTKDGRMMPYYKYFKISIDVVPLPPDPRDILTFLWGATWTQPTAYLRSRISYGGGVGVQIAMERKERNRVPYDLMKYIGRRGEAEEREQMIFSKDYVEPHVLVPVIRYGYLLGVENYEPHALAYAFLEGLRLSGAGTPKGMNVLEAYWRTENTVEPVLVVDIGTNLLNEPVVVSPVITDPLEMIERFKQKAISVTVCKYSSIKEVFNNLTAPKRYVGKDAYKLLYDLAKTFKEKYLEKIDELEIPRVKKVKKKEG